MPARAHLHALIEYNVIQRAVFAYFACLHHYAVFKAGPLPNVYPAEQYAVFYAAFNYAAVRKQAVFNLRVRAVAGGPTLCEGLAEKQTKIHADTKAYEALKGHYPDTLLYKAEESEEKMKEADTNMKSIWNTEWLSMQMGIKTVASEEEALDHIATYGSGHSESIVSNNEAAQKKFQALVDAACVYVNAPTSFTDGAQFGLGAEIGISTQKLGARGPMALEEITTYKWLITGQGQTRA